MDDATTLDISGSLPPAPKDPTLVDTVRELPEYFPSSCSPDEWANWLSSSYNQEWNTYLKKRKVFEREHQEWQAEKAEMERRRDDLARRNVLRAWISLREEAWKAERMRWTAEKNALLPDLLEDERVDKAVVSAVSYASRRIEVKKKSKKQSIHSSQLIVPATDRQPVFESDVVGTVDRMPAGGVLPYPPVDASLVPSQLDPEEQACQQKIEEESVASDISVLQPSSVTDRLHRMLLTRGELIVLKRQLGDLPEWMPEMIRQTLERIVLEYDQQLLRRYNAGVAMPVTMASFLDPPKPTLADDTIISIAYKEPERVEAAIEDKLEVILSPTAKSIRMNLRLANKHKYASSEKMSAIQVFKRYGLDNYTSRSTADGEIMTVEVLEGQLEAWILSYCEQAIRQDQWPQASS